MRVPGDLLPFQFYMYWTDNFFNHTINILHCSTDMEMSWYYCILLSLPLLIILSKFFLNNLRQSKNLPPSPPSLPIIGHLHLLAHPLHRTLEHLSSKYGPVISLQFGCRSAVIVSSSSAVEECFTKNDIIFANRPLLLVGELLNYNHTTVGAAPYGPLWRHLRRIMTLEIFSTVRINKFSGIRQEEVGILLKNLHRLSNQRWTKIEMKSRISEMLFNIIMRMVVGKRYFGSDVENCEKAKCFQEIIGEIFELSGVSNPGDLLPVLKWIDFQNIKKRMLILQHRTDEFLQSLIDESRNRNDNSQAEVVERKTMIEAMLSMQEAEPQSNTDEIIKGIILILLTAATDTSSVTIEWALSLLLNHPEVLKKARTEVDNLVGQDRLINESDIYKLPYIQAIVNETHRLCPAVPLLSPHESSAECSIAEYHIPSKTMLIVNAWAIHRDPQLWDDPTSFRPERFHGLDSDTYKLKLIPFGMGRRACPGSILANRVVVMALASLVQCFEWKRTSEELVDMTEGKGLTMPKAKPLEAMCKAREEMVEVLNGL